jgi:hypothetical protein
MAKTVTISYAGGTIGTDVVNLNLLSNVDSYATPFETSIPKASFAVGYTSLLVPDAATIIRVQATGSVGGVCTGYENITITNPIPPAGIAYIGCGYSAISDSSACSDASANNRTLYAEEAPGTFGVGSIVYVDPNLNTRLTGQSFVFMDNQNWTVNPTTGLITGLATNQC